ncbi:MAG TPA: hypothetical protein VMD75_09180 [Candidatus Binataceae bacterium]|nr:hypothetical protein [Candidatus Binataceae bacterium]
MVSSFLLTALALSLSLVGCSVGQDPQTLQSDVVGESAPAGGSPTARAGISQASDQQGSIPLPGYWVGTTTAFCNLNPSEFDLRCNSTNVITLSLLQEEKGVTGFYKCSFGNQACRDQNDSGKVAASSMHGRRFQMRIALPDLSSCIFQGAANGPSSIRGAYFCYQGGGLMEQGQFQIRREL